MPAGRRTARDEQRRRLGQNFLRPDAADRLIAEADVRSGELVLEPGAGTGALTRALASRGADVVAVELDPNWSQRLEDQASALTTARRIAGALLTPTPWPRTTGRIRVVRGDFLSVRLRSQPYRVIGCPPFGQTTALLRRLLDDAAPHLDRVDVIIQWEVARKRSSSPPSTLLSTLWAPWWEFRLGRRVPASQFRPVPRVDAGVLTVVRRDPPVLPPAMARPYAAFVEDHWPFDTWRRGP